MYADSVVELDDDSFITVGFTREQENVARLDSEGEVIWSSLLGENAGTPPTLEHVVLTSDGNLAAISRSHYSLPRNTSVVKFDVDGSSIWTKDLHIATDNYVGDLAPTDAGGVTVLTRTFLTRLAEDGTENWNTALPPEFVSNAMMAATDNDGVTLLSDDRISRYDADGSAIWSKAFDSMIGTEPIDFRATPDGGFVVGSSTHSNNSTSSYFPRTSWYCQNMVLTKLDGSGDITSEREYSTESISFLDAVAPTSDGGYIILGSRGREFFSSYSYMFLLKVDDDG